MKNERLIFRKIEGWDLGSIRDESSNTEAIIYADEIQIGPTIPFNSIFRDVVFVWKMEKTIDKFNHTIINIGFNRDDEEILYPVYEMDNINRTWEIFQALNQNYMELFYHSNFIIRNFAKSR